MIYERYLEGLPQSVKALIRETPDGDYIIWYNPCYSKEELRMAAQHEIAHIEHRDFEDRDTKNIRKLETQRHVGRGNQRENRIP